MNRLNVCFVGVGSIAKRHIRNLHEICSERNIDLNVDAFRRFPEAPEGVNAVYCNVKDVPEEYDAIFITNPTALHLQTLEQFHDKGKHFFIEKPVVSLPQIEKARRFRTREESVYYVACPLRYNAVIQYLKNNIDPDDVISVRSISSSYLPDWRPGEDYRKTYSAHRNMGGGVSIDLIHEWDYLTYLFGWPQKVDGMIGKKSPLEIDSDDYAIYIAEYKDKIAELHLDYFGRKTIREIQLFTRTDTIIGDIANNTIRILIKDTCLDFHEGRNDFQKRELNHFLDMVLGSVPVEDGYHHQLKVLGLTQANV